MKHEGKELVLTTKQLDSFNRVSRVVRLGVYVAHTNELTENASWPPTRRRICCAVSFGEQTIALRFVSGVASLPFGSPVEFEVVLEATAD